MVYSPILDNQVIGNSYLRTSENRKTRYGKSNIGQTVAINNPCLLYTSPSPRDATLSRMPSSA